MAGVFYLWFVLAFAIGCGGLLLLLVGVFLIGHWLEKKETGARHGFLELPEELRTPKPDHPSSPPPATRDADGPDPPGAAQP